jgi:hypothetical protein
VAASLLTRGLRQRNRDILQSVDRWLDEETWRNARDGYGCPGFAFPKLNLPVSLDPTYTDVIVALASLVPQPVRYLELGVSVGKNLYVVARALEGATVYGLDWEPVSPVLARELTRAGRTLPAAEPGTTRFEVGQTSVTYVQGDELDAATWRRLAGNRFGLVFSDACHSPKALAFEVDQLLEHHLLDPAGFAMVWDDLGPSSMADEFSRLAARLKSAFPATTAFQASVNGSLGEHEPPHRIGIASNIGLTYEWMFGSLNSAALRYANFIAGLHGGASRILPKPVKRVVRRLLRLAGRGRRSWTIQCV